MTLNPFAAPFVPPGIHSSGIQSAAVPQGPVSARLNRKPVDLDNLLHGSINRLVDVHFTANYSVEDNDVIRLVDAVGDQLKSLRLGDSDTGAGVRLTDAAVNSIVARCPRLEVLQLESCTGVTNAAFTAVCRNLSQLLELHCTGHDRRSGCLTARALDLLMEEGTLPRLRRLYLTDQGVDYDAVQRLIKQRKGLQVLAGETDCDSRAWSMVLQQMGRSYGDGLYGNMRY